MFCKQCNKGILRRQYKVVNSETEAFHTDKYFDSLEQAENYYEDMIKEYPSMDWKLYELLICNDCDYVKEKVLKSEKVEEVGSA